jgi:hypothetical protein
MRGQREGLGASMTSGRRAISATKVARDFADNLAPFIESVHALISELNEHESPASPGERCRETCAALWAGTIVSLNASALRADERDALIPLLFAALMPYWKRHCGPDNRTPDTLQSYAERYLEGRQERSQVTSATEIATQLFDSLNVNQAGRRRLVKRLSALLAHRMLGDIHRLNEIKLHFGIQLSLLAGAFSGLPVLHVSDAILRILRLS